VRRKPKAFDDHGGLYVDLRRAKPAEIPCDGCGSNVAGDPTAWVGWWGADEGEGQAVHDFGIHCRPCAAKLQDHRVLPTGEELDRWDVHLGTWSGRWAIIQARGALTELGLRWPPDQMKKMLDFAILASSLPTGRGPIQP
jgi:hypothetical protein